jgi:HD domain
MNRRALMQGLGILAVNLKRRSGNLLPTVKLFQTSTLAAPADTPLPSSVAGVKIIDSKIAKDAMELSRSVSPPYLFNHAMRAYLYGSLVGRALGASFDEEIFFLACILHDLGLTDRFAGDMPFEIQGAEAAKHFLEERAYPKNSTEMVWDGIAMHASAIGQHKRPEIALVGEGAGADVIGPDFSQIKKADSEAIVLAFPRLKFKDAFVKTCADVVQKHPRGAAQSFMRDVGERYVPGFHPRNFCDLIAQAPFEE